MKAIGIALIVSAAIVGAALAADGGTQSAAKVAVSPDWIRKPTGNDLVAVYPSAALDKGQTGKSLIRCEIDTKGGLKDCAVLAESPANAGFGRAALKLTDRFQAPSELAGDEVVIPLRFMLSPGPHRAVLAKDPQFIATPTADEIIKAFPRAAIGHVEKGVVHLHCVYGRCVVSTAEPAGMGFEEAALALGKKFKLDPVWSYRVDAEEIQYDVWIQLAAPDSQVWKTRPLGHIQWLDTPDPQMAQAAFPTTALKAGLSSGAAVVACTVAATGALKDCSVDSEDPKGMGFGQAIVAVAERYVMNPWTDEGLPAAGAHVTLPMKLVHEPDPALTSATKP